MSAAVLSGCDETSESFAKEELLEKCGEIFLEKQLGNLIYLCTLCDDRFKDVDVFSKHISDIHISVENFISYDPVESDDGEIEGYDHLEEDIKQEVEESKEIEVIENEYQESDDGNMNNEEAFNILDSSSTVLDIQVYDEALKGDEKEGQYLDNPADFQLDDKTDIVPPNPIEVDGDTADLADLQDTCANGETVTVPEGGNDVEAADASDKEILRSKIRCKYCGEQFEYVKELRKHDCGLKMGKKLHHCSVCGKIFKKKSGLDIHMMIHKGEKPHKCDICGAAYACKQNLIVHVRRHTGEKPFKCDFCERRFASSTEKISHMRTHTGERPFVCDICGKAHTSSSQLTEHMYRHLDIRNYPCEVCDKRFRNSYNLRMHRLTHEDAPRKFTCEHCLAAFKTQSNLLQHIKIHQKVKKYVCKICGRAFAQHPGLYSHMKSHAIFK